MIKDHGQIKSEVATYFLRGIVWNSVLLQTLFERHYPLVLELGAKTLVFVFASKSFNYPLLKA
jgi:hypothetical protein